MELNKNYSVILKEGVLTVLYKGQTERFIKVENVLNNEILHVNLEHVIYLKPLTLKQVKESKKNYKAKVEEEKRIIGFKKAQIKTKKERK